ncbi:response regulator [Paenibacillus beijingensis]|uniref:AraC family transcriptional regulator n=1 Tax=Paenibacillus beijingensis TaxID=1126833 RepID=A0A0D5NLN8_9BACL|nr:response regulator [Paenibacillus beijingensis]AJY75843.1 hypothetical protein VN24_16375 [Paenibacillus beijingensis]
MKILIVDDEQHAREAVKLLVPWQELGVNDILEADNGEAAKLLMEQHQPQLVLTDMYMPITNGIQFMEWTRSRYPRTRIIAISGYNDFDYVRQAMKYGGLDYILKPIDPDQLGEAVAKALAGLREEENEKRSQVERGIALNQYKPVYWNHLFDQLIQTGGTDGTAQKIRQEFADFPQSGEGQAVIISLFPIHNTIVRKFGGDKELLLFAVINVLNDLVRTKWRAGYAFRPAAADDEAVILFWNGLDLLLPRVQQLTEAVFTALKALVHAGIGIRSPFPAGLAQSVETAREALLQRNLLAPKERVRSAPNARKDSAQFRHLTDLEAPVRMALQLRNATDARAAVENWFGRVQTMTAVTPAQLRLWEREFGLLRTRWFEAALEEEDARELADQPAPPLPFYFDDNGKLLLNETESAWKETIAALIESVIGRARQQRNMIAEMTRYIEEHLKEDLSLQQLSARFYVSREHISRRFKQETGHTLSEHVEQLRVDKAKKLLGNPQLKVTDVAAQVGYSDEKYFSKVFKKQTGFAPNQYRRQQ